MLTKDALERERYEARQKAYRDQMSLLDDARELAREQGLEQGLEKGRREGELIGQIRTHERFLNRPVTPHEELERRSLDELRRNAEALEAEVFGD